MRATALALALTSACATSHLARPVGRGNTRISASLGGPVVLLGAAPIPSPLTTLGVAHGVSDAVDVHGELHPTAAAFGVGALTGGVAWHPVASHRAALTLGASVGAMTNLDDATVFGDLWVSTGGRVTRWLWLGAGLHNGLRVFTTATGEQTPWAPTLFGLAAFHLSQRVTLDVEARWYAMSSCGQCAAPGWVSAGPGALGVLFGLHFQLEGGAR